MLTFKLMLRIRTYVLWHVSTGYFKVRHISSGIFDNVIAKWTFCVEQFFSAKKYLQSRYYKN